MKKVIKSILILCASLVVLALFSFQVVFDVLEQPQQLLLSHDQTQVTPICYQNPSPKPIDKNGHINLLVWNIYKQNRDNWQPALNQFSHDAQLLLLQEASLTDAFKMWIEKQSWGSNYVKAFSAFDISAGVVNLASNFPITACAFSAKEPWLRLPKSGLYALYLLSNGQQLAVVNVHAINFSLGTTEYRQQLSLLREELMQHDGPIIMAGDFNTWSEGRLAELNEQVAKLALHEVAFDPDNRKLFVNGLPLDHVFYKGLTLINAKAPVTDASDHNPLIVNFKFSDSRLKN